MKNPQIKQEAVALPPEAQAAMRERLKAIAMATQELSRHGGPAFPSTVNLYGQPQSFLGATMLDFYATAALQSIILNPGFFGIKSSMPDKGRMMAAVAWEAAQVMLEQREAIFSKQKGETENAE